MPISEDKHRFVVLIDKSLLERTKKVAAKEGRSTSNFIVKIVKDYVEKYEAK